MKKAKAVLASFLFISLMVSTAILAAPGEKMNKTFDKKETIRIKLVLGECRLEKSSDGRIHVNLEYAYEPEMSYEPRMEERGNTLYLEEKLRGKNPDGHSAWTVAVPGSTEIEFKSATGSLYIEGLDVEVDGSTGTGNIDLKNVKGKYDLSTGTGSVDLIGSKGDFDLSSGTGNVKISGSEGTFDTSSGTGNVKIKDCKGDFDAGSGTGNVEAEGLTIEYEGNFSSGTGDAEVAFPEGTNFELTVASGTDDAILDMNGRPIEGYFEFKCHAKRGHIVSPVRFDKEEEYEENDQKYLIKSFTQGKDTPKVYIKTGTGAAKLIK
jgi:hypothetical protein